MREINVTHIENQRQSFSVTQDEVMTAFGMRESEYLNIFHESGCQFLESFEKRLQEQGWNCPEDWYKIKISTLFWKWWRIQFSLKDKELVRTVTNKLDYFEGQKMNPVIIPNYIYKNLKL